MPLFNPYKKVILLILDGFGLADDEAGNAILESGMPHLENLIAQYPTVTLDAAGLAVGLPWGQPGNSEVGHSALGTGRIVVQDLAHINGQIRSGDFYHNPALVEAVLHAKKHHSALHLIGCTSPGGIHSHTDHLVALLELARRHALPRVFVHFIADGQDMPSRDALTVLAALEPVLKKCGARIASVQGRAYAMDRILNWKLTEQVWHAMADGDAPGVANAHEYIQQRYDQGDTDYDIPPATITESNRPVGRVEDDDAVIFYDFRNDRARQLATPFITAAKFDAFPLQRRPQNLKIVTMTKYSNEFAVPVAYQPLLLGGTLGEAVSASGATQWRIAEKEKEAHVTSFFNGGRLEPFDGEQREVVSSRFMRGDQYLVHPEMSAREITDALLERLDDAARLYVVNFANPDMIAHTGNLAATKRAVRIVDDCIGRILERVGAREDVAVVITADHGNAEELIDPLSGGEDTQHSTRPVPLVIAAPHARGSSDHQDLQSLAHQAPMGALIDVAPTILTLLGLPKQTEMSGASVMHNS